AAAGDHPLGATIRAAVEATARWAPSNTNLGLVLLLAPLARAALRLPADGASLRTALAATLAETTVADAREAYPAIRRAGPGGPDSHIARKLGPEEAIRLQRRAGGVVDAGGVRTPTGRAAIAALDRELRNERNARNPGATADLTGAAIYVVLLEGGWGERRERAADGRA